MTSIVPLKPSKSTASIFSEQEITGGKILVPVETEAQIICSMNLKKFIIISFIVTMILFTLLLSICVASITVVRKWVTKGLTLKECGGRIRQYDEALTMSAMMAASNGSSSWVDRYNSIAPLLDANIAKTLAMMPTEKSNKVQKLTEVANIKLVEMETDAMNAVLEGNMSVGRDILYSPEYAIYKEQYAAGVSVIMEYVDGMDKLITNIQVVFAVLTLGIILSFLPTFLIFGACTYKAEKKNQRVILTEKDRSDQLLSAILPKDTMLRMKRGEIRIADQHDLVTIMFLDICEFTNLSSSISAPNVVLMLNTIFSEFDSRAALHNVEKIKTIGDAYMAVAGLDGDPRHAENAIELAFDFLAIVKAFNSKQKFIDRGIEVRIGCHSGPVVSGVIGSSKFCFDIWGDSVNVASRMESMSCRNRINVSEVVHSLTKDMFEFEEKRLIEVKGKGQMNAYFVKGRREY